MNKIDLQTHNESNVLLFPYAPVAQWIERLASDQKVASSTLAGRTSQKNQTALSFFGLVRDGGMFFQ